MKKLYSLFTSFVIPAGLCLIVFMPVAIYGDNLDIAWYKEFILGGAMAWAILWSFITYMKHKP